MNSIKHKVSGGIILGLILFSLNSKAQLNVISSGYVGIGTASPLRPLHVNGELLMQNGGLTNNQMSRFITRNIGGVGITQFEIMNDALSSETIAWSMYRNGQTVNSFNFENGNVGIGTNFNTPTSLLHLFGGDAAIQANTTQSNNPPDLIFLANNGTEYGRIFTDNTATRIRANSSSGGDLNILSSNGYVGLGVITPSSLLHVFGGDVTIQANSTQSTNPPDLIFLANNGTEYGRIFTDNNALNMRSATGRVDLSIRTTDGHTGIGGTGSSSYQMYIYGSLGATGTGTWSISDKRYKKNIRNIEGALDKIKKITGRKYEYNTEEFEEMKFPEGTSVGFIAQEIKEIFPEAVRMDENGYYNLNYTLLIPVLVEAIKEQQVYIDSVKKTNTQQDSLNKNLQNQINQIVNNCCKITIPASKENNQSSANAAILYQNNPNPFTQTTVVKCFVPQNTQNASLLVFDMNGSLKKTFAINEKGVTNITINGNQLVSGMYFYTLLIDGQEIDTKKMILTE